MSSYGNYSESLISKIIFLTHYGRGHSYDFVHSHKKEWMGVNKNSFFKIILSSHGFRDAVYYWSNIDPLMMQVRINWISKESNEVLVTLLLPYLIMFLSELLYSVYIMHSVYISYEIKFFSNQKKFKWYISNLLLLGLSCNKYHCCRKYVVDFEMKN